MILFNKTQNCLLASQVRLCDHYFSRLRGLLGTSKLPENEACWLLPCNSVHTFGMSYALDILFLDRDSRVIRIIQNLRPNRLSPVVWKAHSVIELSHGPARAVKVEDYLERRAQ